MESTFYYYDPAHPLKPFAYSLPGQTEYIELVPVDPQSPLFDQTGNPPQGWTPPEQQYEEIVHKLELPDYAILESPRLDEYVRPMSGEWPILNSTGYGWDYTEDHRQRKDERDRVIEGSGTPYWLSRDDWQSAPRYMTDIGPLPAGALLTKPEKPQSEIANELRQQRDGRINSTQWIVERHADEVAAGGKTTLSAGSYAALLAYRQALRDMPQQAGFPWDGGGDMTPWPVAPASARTA